ncbi:putative phage abortive infection protein [Rhodobacter sp. JA431]|uniref:putative phage abortive infection protein n=1 Tax=Rhodobacter sp. JA431 TaxID=570013 RepID=UPI0014830DF1|nr:putative phage abortive infection protein [Rhodobacter sp. JA431]
MWVANLKYGWTLHGPDDRGTFGDQFGAVNALFTGLAFAGVLYAIFLQRHEVELLHEELERTKQLLKNQEELAQLQLASQRKQIFEGTFFQTLSVFNGIVSGMDLKSTGKPDVTGKDVFPVFLDRIRGISPLKTAGYYQTMEAESVGSSEVAYEDFYKKHASELGHYFRVLYNILKLVDRSDVDDKRFYTNLVRAQLSDDEALLLFINGISPRGEKIKPLLEKYSMLKNVRMEDKIVKWARGRTDYAPSAFA